MCIKLKEPIIEQPTLQDQRPNSASSDSSSSNEATDINFNLTNSLCDNYVEQSYVHLKILCIEKVKKPGRDHSELFNLIQNSQLTTKMRLFLVKELIYEATRFKRVKLIESMNRYSDLLQQLQSVN